MNFALKLCVSHEKINKLWKCEEEPGKVMKVLHAIYQRRGVINKELGRNFLDGMIEMELHQRKKSLYNYFMMSILELLRMADEIKTVSFI